MNLPDNKKMNRLALYFQVHQPRRLNQFSFFDIGTDRDYFDDDQNKKIMCRIAKNCYLPANRLLLKLIKKYPALRITFSVSGSALNQLEAFAPEALESFQKLAATGAVEILSETYYHSLSFLISKDEFESQIRKHAEKVKQLFGIRPAVFRNTELIYNDEIGRTVADLGFKGILVDGINKILIGRSSNDLYQHPDRSLRIMLRNYQLSDDIAFRFNQKDWNEWPLTPKKYVTWLETILTKEKLITLGLDYETFGEHQKANSGIFRFLESTLTMIARHKKIQMATPSEVIKQLPPVASIKVQESISWADENRDLSAWLGNDLQRDAFNTLQKMEEPLKNIKHPDLLRTWRYLQTSDHFYYMSTKTGNDGGVHNYFSPYTSPYAAFMNYMNVLTDLSLQIEKQREMKPHFDFNQNNNFERIDVNWRPEALTF